MGQCLRRLFSSLFMQTRFHQIGAVKWATYCYFALRPAANRTNIAGHSRTITARLACLTDLAFHEGSPGKSYRNIGGLISCAEHLLKAAHEETVRHARDVIAHHAMDGRNGQRLHVTLRQFPGVCEIEL